MRKQSKGFAMILALAILALPVAAYAGASPEPTSSDRESDASSPASTIKSSKLKCPGNKAKVAVWKYAKWVVVCS